MWWCSGVGQVNEAEEERLRSEREHQRVTQLCQEAEARVQTLQKTLRKVILKSKPYFEVKAQFNYILEVRIICYFYICITRHAFPPHTDYFLTGTQLLNFAAPTLLYLTHGYFQRYVYAQSANWTNPHVLTHSRGPGVSQTASPSSQPQWLVKHLTCSAD